MRTANFCRLYAAAGPQGSRFSINSFSRSAVRWSHEWSDTVNKEDRRRLGPARDLPKGEAASLSWAMKLELCLASIEPCIQTLGLNAMCVGAVLFNTPACRDSGTH